MVLPVVVSRHLLVYVIYAEKEVLGYCLFSHCGRGRSYDGLRIAAMDFDDLV